MNILLSCVSSGRLIYQVLPSFTNLKQRGSKAVARSFFSIFTNYRPQKE